MAEAEKEGAPERARRIGPKKLPSRGSPNLHPSNKKITKKVLSQNITFSCCNFPNAHNAFFVLFFFLVISPRASLNLVFFLILENSSLHFFSLNMRMFNSTTPQSNHQQLCPRAQYDTQSTTTHARAGALVFSSSCLDESIIRVGPGQYPQCTRAWSAREAVAELTE